MPRPLLPPNYINCSRVDLLFDTSLPPAVFHTWFQLRALAWNATETPPLSIEQLVELTGKSRSTLYGHMRILDTRSALRWRTASDARLIVSFNDSNNGLDEQSRNLDNDQDPAPTFGVGDDGAAIDAAVDQSRNLDSESRKLDSQSRNLDKPTLFKSHDIDLQERESQSRNLDLSRNLDSQVNAWVERLYSLCKVNPTLARKGMRKRVMEVALVLMGTFDLYQLDLFEKRWYETDFRGKNGSPPTPEQVCNSWEIIMKPGGNGNGKHSCGDPAVHQPSSTDDADRIGANPALAALAKRAGE